MEVCSEIRLEDDHISAMNIFATSTIDFTALSARSSNSGSDSIMEDQFMSMSIAKNNTYQRTILDVTWLSPMG